MKQEVLLSVAAEMKYLLDSFIFPPNGVDWVPTRAESGVVASTTLLVLSAAGNAVSNPRKSARQTV